MAYASWVRLFNSETARREFIRALVILIHAGVVWILAVMALPSSATEDHGREIQIALLGRTTTPASSFDAVPEPSMQSAGAPDVEVPQIEIGDSAAADSPAIAEILPPRPDPAIVNVSPTLPAGLAGAACQVALTILVDDRGRISEARVAQSCGRPELDNLAASYAKAHWSFRPATANGKAVADWTTVMVRFLAGR